MKKLIMTSGMTLMLLSAAVLGAQGRYNGPGHNPRPQPPANHHSNNSYQHHNQHNQMRKFTGFLVVNERDIRHNNRFGFHITLNSFQITHIDFMGGKPARGSYGIIVERPNGGYAYYRLDKKGSMMAHRMISHRNRNNIFVEVRGHLNPNTRIINVASMERIRRGNHYRPGYNSSGAGQWG